MLKHSVVSVLKSRLIRSKRMHLILMAVLSFLLYLLSYPPFQMTDVEEERYLAYLPHSGLSNQRIELANALMLAFILNRTLVIPPAFLGSVFGWMNRGQIVGKLEWLTTPKNFTDICQTLTPGRLSSYVQRSKCAEYHQFGVIPWSLLHDLEPLQRAGIRFVFQHQNISLQTLQHQLNLRDDQIYLHQDSQLYDWRLYQNHSMAQELLVQKSNYFDSFAGRRFYRVLMPHHFRSRTEKLLYLGGVFGSTRLNLIHPRELAIQEEIRQALLYRLDTPLGKTVQNIVNHLGGPGSFMSVHFRTGDRPFRKELRQNLQAFMKNMTLLVQQDPVPECPVLQQQSELVEFQTRAKIYIATDHRHPKETDSPILKWFDRFPCTSLLSDIPNELLDPLNDIRDSVEPSKSLRKFLIPLVDAMVAAHGKHILTTPRSTFSSYIEQLHQSWIPT